MDLTKFLGRFRDAVADHRKAIERLLQRLGDSQRDPEGMTELRRRFHTLKGESRMMGFEGIADLSHAAEDLLEAPALDPGTPDLLLAVLDAAQRLMEGPPEERDEPLLARLAAAARGRTAATARTEAERPSASPRFLARFRESARERVRFLNAAVARLTECPGDGATFRDLLREVHTLKGEARMMGFTETASLTHSLEDLLKALRDGDRLSSLGECSDLLYHVADALDVLADAQARGSRAEVDLEGLEGALRAAERGEGARAPARPAGGLPQPAPVAPPPVLEETVRISVEKLERLAGLTGDLLVRNAAQEVHGEDLRKLMARAKDLERLLRQAGANRPSAEDPLLEAATRLRTGLQSLLKREKADFLETSLALAELRTRVQEVRMLPISTIFDFYPRIVRDMARGMGKEVRLILEGRETELDRRILEEIQDPLVHLIRNALDHGIEPADLRRVSGKPRHGTLRLSARPEGDRIAIVVEDDGRGMDPAAVRRAAVSKGVVSEQEASGLDAEASLDLVFHPGFSTREKVTEMSGRGVGMDVVRGRVAALGGNVSLRSRPGEGTSVTLSVPLTLALLRVLLLRAGGQIFAVPSTEVEDVVRAEVRDGEGSGRYILRADEAVPLKDLGGILRLTAAETWGAPATVILSGRGRRLGFTVEAVLGEREVVVKGLGAYLHRQTVVSGASVLGDGSIALVLNAVSLIEEAGAVQDLAPSGNGRGGEEAEGAAVRARILVVDDSMVVRDMMRGILEGAGFGVEAAVDGQDALGRLRRERYDLVVSDVQMPRLDGLTLSRAIRAERETADIPIVILTTLDGPDSRRAGLEAGVDAYLVKKELQAGEFLATVRHLLASGRRADDAVC